MNQEHLIEILYKTTKGRILLKKLTNQTLSIKVGKFMDSHASALLVKPFIRSNNIDMNDYLEVKYRSFNDFFTRKLRTGARPVDMDNNSFIAPCDGLLSVYEITDGMVMPIKHSHYTVSSLLKNEKIAEHYDDGYALVFRLCVDNYHRYHYLDDCTKSDNHFIKGILHTVNPIALEKYPVYTQNSREYCIMKTRNFGVITQVEVGAMLVGKIVNHHKRGNFRRGEEKGKFIYGGSTIVVLVQPDKITINNEILENSKIGKETPVKFGEKIGTKL